MTASPPSRAIVVDPADGSPVSFLGGLLQTRAGGKHTGGRLAVVQHRARRGYSSPVHVHADDAESFLVIEGSLRVVCGGEEHA
ncbi:MAG: hypothetical protein ACRDLR_03980, partial [Gaiellaceae bacterium]